MSRSVMAMVLLASVAFAGGRKAKKKVTPPAAEAEVKKALDATQEKVGACVVSGAGAGAWTQVVKLKVVINGVGQVLSFDASLEPANDAASKTRACVEEAVRAAPFPKTHAPLVTVEREWTFKLE